MVQSEDIQYFSFDKEGNMYVYEAGAGFSGDCHLVKPGDEMIFNTKSSGIQQDNVGCGVSVTECSMPTQVISDGSGNKFKEEMNPV